MGPDQINHQLEGKRFKLAKYFAWASFIVLMIFSFPFSMIISQKAKETLIQNHEKIGEMIGENLRFLIVEHFVRPILSGGGYIKLSDPSQYKTLDEIVQTTIYGLNIELFNIYDIDKNTIAYSTDTNLIGTKAEESLGYKKALSGENFPVLITEKGNLWGLGIEFIGGKKKLRTYIPLKGNYLDPEYVSGVFELTQDITEQYASVVRFRYMVFGLSILIMGLIFVILLFIVHKAEIIIERRAKEQSELEAQLHHAERLAALGEMVAGVSHEIKNPLGIIQSTAELLSETAGNNEKTKRLSTVIMEEALRLNNIVTEFLDFARPPVLNIRPCRLDDILEKNLNFLQPELEKRGIKSEHNFIGRSFTLQADQDQLYRAFLNIMLNALQSMPKKDGQGILKIKAEKERDFYEIEIEDNGSGITAENMKKIFNPFFTTKEKGTGLGLAIVKKIIEGHQGSITIESLEGQGTKTKIRLPRPA